VEHIAELAEYPPQPHRAEPAVFRQQAVQRDPRYVLHYQEWPQRVVRVGGDELDDVRVVEPGQRLDFALEALTEAGLRRDVLVHELYHDGLVVDAVARQVSTAHAALAEKAHGFVSIQEDVAQHERFLAGWPALTLQADRCRFVATGRATLFCGTP
jgi:hypothetical protein